MTRLLPLVLLLFTSFAPVSCGEIVVISRYAGQFIEPLSKSGVDFLVIDPRSYDSLIVGANLGEVREETCKRIRNASTVVLYRSSGLTELDPYSAPEYTALAEALSRGVPFYVYQNNINIPTGSAKAEVIPLADREVDVGGVEIPLYLFLTTLSERNLIQFFRYVSRGEPFRAFYLDGLLSLYDPLTDTVVSYDRPVDPIVILRYQREFPHGEVLSSYHGVTVYPRWFVELIRSEVLLKLREIFDRYRRLGELKGFYTPGAPTVFVIFDSVNLLGRHLGYLDWLRVLTERLRNKGFNVVPIALHYDVLYMLPEDFLKALEPLVKGEHMVCIMWVVNHSMMRYYGPDSRIVRLFERLEGPSALSLINLCRMLDVVAAEPWIAHALGERSYLSPTARPHGATRWDALRDVLGALRRSLEEVERRLREEGHVPKTLRELLDRALARLERDPLGVLRELHEGLKELNDYVVVGLRDLVGWNLAELLWSVAVGTGLWIPPSRNAPFLHWAVAYLVLEEALREGLPSWLLGELSWENLSVMAGVAVFTQCPGEFIAPVLPMIEAGLYTEDHLESLGLRALVGMSYTVLPYTRSELVGTRQPFLHCPLALALAVATSDTILQVFDSYDDYSNLFCCGCTVDLEASLAALTDYLLRREAVEREVLDVSKVGLGAFKPGWNVAKSAGRLARLVGWVRALNRVASNLKEEVRRIEHGSGALVSTRAYLVRSLLRTLYNEKFIRGLRRFGISGALYFLRSLKRFATLGYVAIGRYDLKPILSSVWSTVQANADWLASVPATLASASFSLVRISTDLGVSYPHEALSWITKTTCCCPELCSFQIGIVEGMTMETVTMVSRTVPTTRTTLRPTVHATLTLRPTVHVASTVPAAARVAATVLRVAVVTGAVIGPKSSRPTGVSIVGVTGKITGGAEKGVGSTAVRTGRVLTRELRATPTSYFPRWLLVLALLAGCLLAVWWARRYEPGPREW